MDRDNRVTLALNLYFFNCCKHKLAIPHIGPCERSIFVAAISQRGGKHMGLLTCQWHWQVANMRVPTSCHRARCPTLCSPASGRLESFPMNKSHMITKGGFQVGEPQLTQTHNSMEHLGPSLIFNSYNQYTQPHQCPVCTVLC